jgi:hypothetical protein
VFTPALATVQSNVALAFRRAAESFWTSLSTTHRDITTTVAISAAVHVIVLIAVGSALYASGNDERDVPELSVQIEPREGPNSEEYTEAALPKPAPEPIQDVLDDPGTSEQTIDAAALADSVAQVEKAPDVDQIDDASAQEEIGEVGVAAGAVITTTAETDHAVAAILDPEAPAAAMPQPEQAMLTKNVQRLARKLLDTNLTKAELTWQQDGQQYSARVLRQPAVDSTGLEQVVAEIMTNKDGKRMKTRLSLKRLAFSHFTQLVNHWDPNIQLHDDIIDGRFHSNTEIGMTFRGGIEPRFFGKVTTAAASMTFDGIGMSRRNKDVFQGGMETRTERVTLPRDMPDVVNGGEKSDRRVFANDTRIIFNADGSYVWVAANGSGEMQREEASNRPRYLIGEPGSTLHVRGTVSGIFTVYSPSDIEIEGDLMYSRDPREVLISGDFLALIAGRDIKIASHEVTGVGDLHVHAAIFARRSFYIEEVEHAKPAVLFMLGSLTAGTIMETEPRYATKLDYDKRFEYLRPANFPMTRRYEVESWNQDWQEVEGAETGPPAADLARSE